MCVMNFYVSMYVSMNLCMYACMYACMYVHANIDLIQPTMSCWEKSLWPVWQLPSINQCPT